MSDDKIVPPLSEDSINIVAAMEQGVRESADDAPDSVVTPQNKSLLMKAGDSFRAQPKSIVLIECLLLIAAVGYADYSKPDSGGTVVRCSLPLHHASQN